MAWNIVRLRIAIVAVAAFLLLAILSFFLYARWRVRHLAQDLPARLGLQIQQSTQGFVLSKTERGRAVFTLHASRAVAFKSGGRVLLHNVKIDVYNQAGQADTISGKNFQYDRNNQIVESQGEAHILLHPPQNSTGGGVNKNAGQVIRVTTHGLVFNQKTGVATCSGEVDFQVADSKGRAVGAEYDSQRGHLLLQSQVMLTTSMSDRPAVVHATHAEYDRGDSLVHLLQPQYSSETQQGEQLGSAESAAVLLRSDGSAKHLEAQGKVHFASSNGDTVQASSLQAALNENSRPQHVHFLGNVQFEQKQFGQQSVGSAREALLDFDGEGRAQRAVFDRDVQFRQRMHASTTDTLRTLHAQHLDLHLVPGKSGPSQLQSAEATGNAVFDSLSSVAGKTPQATRISGQILNARFLPGNQIEHLDGSGQTAIRTVALNGDVDASSGDTLSIDFATGLPAAPTRKITPQQAAVKSIPTKSSGKAPTDMSAQSIRYAVQTGNVVLQQTSGKQPGTSVAPQVTTATAARAEYRSSNDTVVLTGQPVFRNSQMELAANAMEVQRATGKMTAMGAVQGTLRPGAPSNSSHTAGNGLFRGGSQPVHIIAAQAVLLHDPQSAIFTGHARLWQGGDTVEAPVIEMSQKMQTLLAYSQEPCTQCVHSIFAGQAAQAKSARPANMRVDQSQFSRSSSQAGASPRFDRDTPQIFRVRSERLIYSDAERKATFIDHVEVIHANDRLFADHADIFLSQVAATPSSPKKPSSFNAQPSQASVQRIVATGNVRLIQPGRRATGAQLVYTAADGNFVLTGDGNQPQVVDAVRGTLSGPVLTFASQEQAIIVGGTSARPTTTETRVKKK